MDDPTSKHQYLVTLAYERRTADSRDWEPVVHSTTIHRPPKTYLEIIERELRGQEAFARHPAEYRNFQLTGVWRTPEGGW